MFKQPSVWKFSSNLKLIVFLLKQFFSELTEF